MTGDVIAGIQDDMPQCRKRRQILMQVKKVHLFQMFSNVETTSKKNMTLDDIMQNKIKENNPKQIKEVFGFNHELDEPLSVFFKS